MSRIIAAITAVALALTTACTKDTNLEVTELHDNAPLFTASTIEQQSRVTTTSNFSEGDTFGIFQNYGEQVKYIYTTSDYHLELGSSESSYFFNDQKDDIFYAYSPYDADIHSEYNSTENVNEYSVPIDVSDQSVDIDLLITDETTSTDGSRYVELIFRHALSLVEVTLEASDSVTEEDLSQVEIYVNCISDGYYCFTTSAVELGTTTSKIDFTDHSAILIPGAYSDVAICFVLPDGTLKYQLLDEVFDSGYKYSYTAKVGDDFVELTLDDESIAWSEESVTTTTTSEIDIYFDGSYYNIFTAKGMKAFADLVNGNENSSEALTAGSGFAEFGKEQFDIGGKLMNDIDLSTICSSDLGDWAPIGTDLLTSDVYQGTFDGCGHEISGLYINDTSGDTSNSSSGGYYKALFGAIENATIMNLGVDGNISGFMYAAGIVGNAYNSCYIINCYNKAEVSAHWTNAAGIVARINSSPGDVTNNCYVVNCYNSGNISIENTNDSNIGGVICLVDKATTYVYNCYNIGSVEEKSGAGAVMSTLYTPPYYNFLYYNSETSNVDDSRATAKPTDEMQHESFAMILNSNAYNCNQDYSAISSMACAWQYNEGDYPTHDFGTMPSESANILCELVDGVYEIGNALGLRLFAAMVNGGATSINGILTADIDLEDTLWTPIGSRDVPYEGDFDGDGHAITGLYVVGNSDGQGLFGYCESASIEDLSVGGSVSNSGGNGTAIICGLAMSSTEIYNCSTLAGSTVVVGDGTGDLEQAAGIVGYIKRSTVERCVNRADITGEEYCGGIAAYVSNTKIYYCANFGSVTGVGSDNFDAGGVVGRIIYSDSEMANCYSIANVSHEGDNVGGVVGSIGDSATVRNCYSSGTLSGASNVGGAIGENDATAENCYYNSSLYTGTAIGVDTSTATATDCTGYSTAKMTGGSLRLELNTGLVFTTDDTDTLWVDGVDGYPTFEFITE